MSFLTGNIDVDLSILSLLDNNSLFNFLLANKYAELLFNKDLLWNLKIINLFPVAEKYKSKEKKWIKYYRELRDTNKKAKLA